MKAIIATMMFISAIGAANADSVLVKNGDVLVTNPKTGHQVSAEHVNGIVGADGLYQAAVDWCDQDMAARMGDAPCNVDMGDKKL